MKFLISLLLVASPLAMASGYNAVSGQLFSDRDSDPTRGPSNDPTPYNEPRPDNDPLRERQPYGDPDDSPDYVRERERLDFQNYLDQQERIDPRYAGVICNHILSQHSRWR